MFINCSVFHRKFGPG